MVHRSAHLTFTDERYRRAHSARRPVWDPDMALNVVNRTVCDVQRIKHYQSQKQADFFTGLSGDEINENFMEKYKTCRVHFLQSEAGLMRLTAVGLTCSKALLSLCYVNLKVSEGFLTPFPSLLRPRAMATKLNDRDCQGESLLSSPKVFPSDAPLPSIEEGVTVLSFNVLLPNGNDGWWIYKVNDPGK